jgi:DNA-binding SARP family transcriptional activator
VEACDLLVQNGASPEQARRAVNLAAGWPMALAMFSRCARSGSLDAVLNAVSGAEMRELVQYLTNDALSTFDDSARLLLQIAALVPNTRMEDLRYALAPVDAEAVLDAVAPSPFVRRDGTSIEIHPLVRMTLSRLPREAATLAIAMSARAQESFAPLRAAELFLCADRSEEAARVLQALGAEALRVGHVYSRLLASIDSSVLVQYPALWMAAAQSRLHRISSAQYAFECNAVLQHLHRCDSPPVRAMIAGISISVFHETLNGALARQVLERARSDAADDPQASMLMQYFGALHNAFLDRPPDPAPLRVSLAPILLIPEIRFSFEAMVAAPYERIAGRIGGERAALERALEAAMQSQMPTLVPLGHWELTYFHWRTGDAERYAHHLSRCEMTLSDAQVPAFAALIACARGDAEATSDAYPRLRMYAAMMGASACADVQKRVQLLREAQSIAQALGQPSQLALAEAALALTTLAERPRHEAKLTVNVLRRKARMQERDVDIAGRKFELLALLALAKRGLTRSEVTAKMWPDAPENRARNSLGVTVNALRDVLGRDAIVFKHGAYTLEMPADVDVNRIDAVAKRLRASRTEVLSRSQYAEVVRAVRDLQALDERTIDWEWFKGVLARLSATRRELLLALTSSDFLRGSLDDALEHAQTLVALDPCDEEARVLRMKVHLVRGDRASAFAEYREYACVLREELGIEPSPEVLFLVRGEWASAKNA